MTLHGLGLTDGYRICFTIKTAKAGTMHYSISMRSLRCQWWTPFSYSYIGNDAICLPLTRRPTFTNVDGIVPTLTWNTLRAWGNGVAIQSARWRSPPCWIREITVISKQFDQSPPHQKWMVETSVKIIFLSDFENDVAINSNMAAYAILDIEKSLLSFPALYRQLPHQLLGMSRPWCRTHSCHLNNAGTNPRWQPPTSWFREVATVSQPFGYLQKSFCES